MEPQQQQNAGKVKVLIIDDDTFLLDMYSLKFAEKNFDVQVSSSSTEALALIEGGLRPEVLLVDVVMPGMDGFEFLAALKQKNITGIKHIVVLSNLGQKEDIEKGLLLGANDYIVKANFTPSEVVAKIESLIAK
jgi:CheY-like chemotaxis protein